MDRQDQMNGSTAASASDAQHESQDPYRTLFDLAPIAVYSCDASGVVRDYNNHAVELWGRTPKPGDTDERFCGSFKLYRPDGTFMPHEQSPMGDVLTGKVPGVHDAEVHIERPDGSRVIVIVNIAPVKNGRGEITGAINCFYNITERKQAEGALFHLAAIVESSDDAIISKDLNGIITSWNRGAERLFGYTAQEAIGQPISMLIPADWHDEETEILKRIRRGTTVDHYETIRRHKDGTPLDISLTVSPIIDGRGQIVGASKIARNITERKRDERTLQASEARYRHLYESIDEGFCIIQMVFDAKNTPMDYIFLEVNPSFEEQSGIVNARGQSMRAIASRHEDHWFELFGQVALTGESRRFEFPAAELHRWFEGYAYRVGEAHERKVSIIFKDITARKGTEAQLRHVNDELEVRVEERTEELTRSQKRLRALAAELNVTEQRERQRLAAELHDYLGQLLALSQIKLSQAKQEPLQPPVAKIIADVQAATGKALTYTRTLISQLSPPVLHEFGLPMALNWLTEHMKQQDLSVSLEINTKIPTLPEDHALLLFQSIRELLINCVKHAGTQEATVTVEQIDESLYFHISDHGVGFDPLVSASKKDHSPARGFGLFSIRERMLALGGRFELESSPGHGTTATLVLPLIDRPVESSVIASHGSTKEEENEEAHNREQAPDVPKVRVLVADDHAMVRQGLCSVLKQYSDIEVVGEAANGEEAVALADSLQPDVVLMDVTMPKLDGIEATRLLKVKHPAVVVIGLSIHTAGQVEAAMIEAGAAAFINKEAAVEELYQTIQTARRSTDSRPMQ